MVNTKWDWQQVTVWGQISGKNSKGGSKFPMSWSSTVQQRVQQDWWTCGTKWVRSADVRLCLWVPSSVSKFHWPVFSCGFCFLFWLQTETTNSLFALFTIGTCVDPFYFRAEKAFSHAFHTIRRVFGWAVQELVRILRVSKSRQAKTFRVHFRFWWNKE